MDARQFTEKSPGTLTSIGHNEYAFLPDPLPPGWAFPLELWPLLSEAKQLIGILEGLGRNLPNPAILLRPLADREAIRSSSLEGTYATPRELLLYELQPREATSEHDKTNEQREVFNYRRALYHGVTSNLPLSLRLVRELHAILLDGVRGKDRSPGEFRRLQVAIGISRRFVPPPPERIHEQLDSLERYFHAASTAFDPLVNCCLIHYQFESIHPFVDGNGRVGRLLLAIMLFQCCQLTKPWLYLSEFFERNRAEYMQRLFEVSTHGRWHEWIDFCLRGTRQHAKETIERCERLLSIREQFMKRVSEVGGSIRLNQIVESIFHSPFVRIADLPKHLNVTYPTAKADVERLVQAGILKELPDVPIRTYYSPEVFNVAYDEMEA